MEIILENDHLCAKFSLLGAELKSCFDKNLNKELIYDGKGTWWNRSAPVLFPIVGKLKNDSYSIENKSFELNQHGFARNSEFEILKQTDSQITFSLESNSESLKKFPFDFSLQISYELSHKSITTTYKVLNRGTESMPFSIGAHPGFMCVFFENETFEDYYLEFEKEENLSRHLLNPENGLFNGESELVTPNSKIINLVYSLFEKDAIVLKKLNSEVIYLKNKQGTFTLKFSFEDFPYFGIWTKNKAPFICLEPWCGLADNENSNQNFYSKEGINLLESNQTFERSYTFEVLNHIGT